MKKKEKQKLHLFTQQMYWTFLKLMQPMQKSSHCLINLISRLGLEVRNFTGFASDRASVLTSVNNGVAAQLQEDQDTIVHATTWH